MLDLGVFSSGTVRGAAITQIGTSIAMAGVMFGLILHFQYAYGWSPMRAGLANLPLIITMIAATPLSEWLAEAVRPPGRLPHRHRPPGGLTAGHRLGRRARLPRHRGLHGRPDHRTAHRHDDLRRRTRRGDAENRTSIGAALNDTAQEIGTSVGTAVVGTMIAALVTTSLPPGIWSAELVQSLFHGERVTFLVLAAIVGLVATFGSLSLTDSRSTEEH